MREHDVDVTRGRARPAGCACGSVGRAEGGLVLTFDDITRLVAAQRNAAWRDVARRIAHEIKNPLTPIQLSAERLRRKYRKRDRPATSRPSTAAPTPSSARWATSAAWWTSSPPSRACRRRSSPRTDAAELLRAGRLRPARGRSGHRARAWSSRRPAAAVRGRRAHGRPGADQCAEERRRGDRRAPRWPSPSLQGPHHARVWSSTARTSPSRSRTTASACRPRTATG